MSVRSHDTGLWEEHVPWRGNSRLLGLRNREKAVGVEERGEGGRQGLEGRQGLILEGLLGCGKKPGFILYEGTSGECVLEHRFYYCLGMARTGTTAMEKTVRDTHRS